MSYSVFENVLMMYARRFPIRRGKLRVIDSLWQTGLSGACTRRVATLKHSGFKMSCDISEMLQRQFYFFGTYFVEEDILRCWEVAAKGAKIILDVGANAGIYSLAALAIQSDAIVHAFEPTPEIAARLRATANLNGLDHLHVHEVAVLNKNGQASLMRFRGELGTNEGMNFILRDLGDSGAERVQTVCIDQFCEDHWITYIDLMKIDTQGHEYSALEGAERLIRSGHVGTIFLELNWAKNANASCAAAESIRFLEQAGYRFSRPGRRLNWGRAGDWLESLSDVVAKRVRP
ncbi:MAG: FkbM family methyltransferase [Candidatus Sulfotelmatobacter sp.]